MLFNGHIFTNQYGENFRRVNKTEARNLAKAGHSIGVCACKLNPSFNQFYNYCKWYHPTEEAQAFDGYKDFDSFVNSYEFYNCSNETGLYASYYVEVGA